MLAKTVSENRKDWDQHLPQVLFAYRTSLHESTRFTPFFLNFGRSPNLPVDVMLGRGSEEEESEEIPQYVQRLQRSLKNAFTLARHHLNLAQKRRQEQHQRKHTDTEDLNVGDRVWLFVPAVKAERTRKLASLWRGPYTVISKTSPVNYRIQLIGTSRTLVVHRNRLKLCYGEPSKQITPQRKPPARHSNPGSSHQDSLPRRSYAEVTATQVATGGYTSSANIGTTEGGSNSREANVSQRPQRTRRPPDHYGNPIPH